MDKIMSRLAAATTVVHPQRVKPEPVVRSCVVHPNIHPAAPEVLITPQEPAVPPAIAGNSHPASLSSLHLPQ